MSFKKSSFRITHVHMSNITFSPISGPKWPMLHGSHRLFEIIREHT